jgi:hypothetical protein
MILYVSECFYSCDANYFSLFVLYQLVDLHLWAD